MRQTYDLIVLGAGMAGITAAKKCASEGWTVAIVDRLPYGGTCALRGCDPKKILRRGAEIVDSARLMQGKGIEPGSLAIDWSDLMAHKRSFTEPMPEKMEAGLARSGVETLHGSARFTGPNALEIDGAPVTARHVLIATGARARRPDIPGTEHMIDSAAFLELKSLPRRILFVGGGFISFEFAHIAARAGSRTVIVDRGERPLKAFDPDLVEMLVERGSAAGIEVQRRTELRAVARSPDGFAVTVEQDGRQRTVAADLVVLGAGRVPQLGDLDLEAAGVEHGPGGVTVAGHMQSTTNPAVYAAGDAADTPALPLTPVAVIEGKVVASNMLKRAQTVPDYTGVPSVVFTVPELARVGMLEEEARTSDRTIDVRFTHTSDWYANMRIGETSAAVKIIVDTGRDTFLGAHMFGPGYGELINIIGLAMKLGLTTRQITSMPAAYPSLGSDLGPLVKGS